MAARPKALVCGRSPAEIMGSNPTRDRNVCLLWVLCVDRWWSLRRADHSSRGILPTVVRRCVWCIILLSEVRLTNILENTLLWASQFGIPWWRDSMYIRNKNNRWRSALFWGSHRPNGSFVLTFRVKHRVQSSKVKTLLDPSRCDPISYVK
jgi:hypothetical protein